MMADLLIALGQISQTMCLLLSIPDATSAKGPLRVHPVGESLTGTKR